MAAFLAQSEEKSSLKGGQINGGSLKNKDDQRASGEG